jgi:hypothetical protein
MMTGFGPSVRTQTLVDSGLVRVLVVLVAVVDVGTTVDVGSGAWAMGLHAAVAARRARVKNWESIFCGWGLEILLG